MRQGHRDEVSVLSFDERTAGRNQQKKTGKGSPYHPCYSTYIYLFTYIRHEDQPNVGKSTPVKTIDCRPFVARIIHV